MNHVSVQAPAALVLAVSGSVLLLQTCGGNPGPLRTDVIVVARRLVNNKRTVRKKIVPGTKPACGACFNVDAVAFRPW